MRRVLPDPFMLALLATVALAVLLPAQGPAASIVNQIATGAVVVLFFLHGVRLSREHLIAALTHWRLHLAILATTFVFMPLAGLLFANTLPWLLPAGLWAGVLFLCAVPSTVQTSIAMASMAGGNVGASVASAAASNLLGIFITPLLASLMLQTQGSDVPLSGIGRIMLQLLLPFVLGHLLRPFLAEWATRQKPLLTYADRITVLLSVYTAFSAAVIGGVWQQVSVRTLILLTLICLVLLGMVIGYTMIKARALRFNQADARTLLYSGSLKSLVSGVPMARVLFPGSELGLILLPMMIYHQLQLMVCATLARRQGEATHAPLPKKT